MSSVVGQSTSQRARLIRRPSERWDPLARAVARNAARRRRTAHRQQQMGPSVRWDDEPGGVALLRPNPSSRLRRDGGKGLHRRRKRVATRPVGEQRAVTGRVRGRAVGRCACRTAPHGAQSVMALKRVATRPADEQRAVTCRARGRAGGRSAHRTSSSPNADAARSHVPSRRRRRSPGPARCGRRPSRRCATGAGSWN